MTRHHFIDPAVLLPDGLTANYYIKYENLAGRAKHPPVCMVTFVFPNSSQTLTMDAARLCENSWFINERIQKPWFDGGACRINILEMTQENFRKYTEWVKYLRISRTNLAKLPEGQGPLSKSDRECLVMDRLVHWWLLGEAMEDAGLMDAAMELLNQYAREEYELPISFEKGWARSQDGSELRSWIFNMMKHTMTVPVLEARGEHLPRDLATKLLVWLVQERIGM